MFGYCLIRLRRDGKSPQPTSDDSKNHGGLLAHPVMSGDLDGRPKMAADLENGDDFGLCQFGLKDWQFLIFVFQLIDKS